MSKFKTPSSHISRVIGPRETTCLQSPRTFPHSLIKRPGWANSRGLKTHTQKPQPLTSAVISERMNKVVLYCIGIVCVFRSNTEEIFT